MRLLFAIKAMNNPGGGAERVLAQVCNGLARRGHDVAVLTFEAPGGSSFYPLEESVQRIELGIGSTSASAGVLETARRILALRGAATAHDPNIAVGFMISMFVPLGLALVGTGIPMLASEHIVPEYYRDKMLQRWLLRSMPALAVGMLCVSEQVRAAYGAALRPWMEVVPNPIMATTGKLASVGRSHGSRNVLLSAGRLVPQKDYTVLIEAFAMLAAEFPSWVLRIVGDGDERARLEELAQRLGVADRVELPGSTAKIGEEYVRAELYAVSSRYESFGLATAEAIAHGLPAVGFADCPGTNELIRNGINGILVSSGADRGTALAAALRPLMGDPDRRRRLSDPGDIVDRFGIEAILDRWEHVLYRHAGNADPIRAGA